MDYDRTDIPKTYKRGRDLAPDVLKQWMDVVAGHLGEESVRCIVDLGCGTGRFSPSLAERFAARVIGIDPSMKMLAEAWSNATTSGPGGPDGPVVLASAPAHCSQSPA